MYFSRTLVNKKKVSKYKSSIQILLFERFTRLHVRRAPRGVESPEIVVHQLEVDDGKAQLVEPPRVQVVQVGVLDVELVVEHRVEFVLERADHALERLHLLAHDRDAGPDRAGEVAARARRYAAAHRAVQRRVVQYGRARDGGHGGRQQAQLLQARRRPAVHGGEEHGTAAHRGHD